MTATGVASRWRLPLVGAVLLALAPTTEAQTGTIAGRVLDAETAEPVAGANVVIRELQLGSATDAGGRFRIERVPAGEHRIVVSHLGFEAREEVVRVEPSAVIDIEVALRPGISGFFDHPVVAEADRLRTVGRTRALPQSMPQATSAIGEATLRAQGALDVEDALQNMSGVVAAGREQPYGTFTLRGLPADGTGTFRRNGVEIPHYADALRPNVVAVEFLKGPASVLYGRIEPGGVVNVVTRRPRCRSDARRAEVGLDGFGSAYGRGTVEPICTPGTAGLVVDASVERRATYRDQAPAESAFLAFAGDARPFPIPLRLTVDAEYEGMAAGLDPGLGLGISHVPTDFDRAPFFGEPDARYRWRHGFGSATAEYWPATGNPVRSITGRVAYGAYRHARDLVSLDSLDSAGMLARSLRSDDTLYRYLYGEVSLDAEASTGRVGHELVVGLEATRLAIDVDGNAPLRRVDGGFQFSGIEPVALANPQPTGLPGEGEVVEYLSVTGSGLNVGLFAQNRMSLETAAGRLSLVASARLSRVTASAVWFALADTEETPAGINERSIAVTSFTPSAAVMFEPHPGLSAYASYGSSFNPVFQQVAADGQPFEPTRGEQLEAGLKYAGGRLNATLAAYTIEKRGALSQAPDGFYVQTGAQRSRGLELEVEALPAPRLTILGVYAFADAVVTADELIPVGNRLPAAPAHSGRLWTRYAVLDGGRLAVSAGLRYVGRRFATLENDLELRAHALIDAGVTVRPLPRLELQLTGDNLLDAHYFITAERRDGSSATQPLIVGWPGPPRNLRLRLSVEL